MLALTCLLHLFMVWEIKQSTHLGVPGLSNKLVFVSSRFSVSGFFYFIVILLLLLSPTGNYQKILVVLFFVCIVLYRCASFFCFSFFIEYPFRRAHVVSLLFFSVCIVLGFFSLSLHDIYGKEIFHEGSHVLRTTGHGFLQSISHDLKNEK